MNILIFSWRGLKHPNFGGAEIVTHEYAKAWIAAGHEVTLFTSTVPNAPAEETIDGIRIIRRGHQLGTVHVAAVIWYLFSHHPKYDLVIDQFHGIPFFTPLFVWGKKLAFIHEVAKEVWWSNHLKFPFNYIFGLIGYITEPAIFWLYSKTPFLTVSESTQQDLINLSIPKTNISVIHSGVISHPRHFSKSTTPAIMYLGAIAKDKGIEDALAVFLQLANKHPNWHFWVVGKGESHYMASLSIHPRVKFWGFVSEAKKFELLTKSWVLLNPSHREGWGLVNIEANSVGTPVVAYNVPGCQDSVIDFETGLLCPRNDTACLASKCELLLADNVLRTKLVSSAEKWSKGFSWEKSTAESLKLLAKLTHSNHSQQKS